MHDSDERPQHGRLLDIGTLEAFDRFAARAHSMYGWRIQDVDLRERGDVLARLDGYGALVLGSDLPEGAQERLTGQGALVFDDVPEVPFNAYRSTLYSPDDLVDGLEHGYAESFDARVYAWSRTRHHDIAHTLAAALHDHSIDDALTEWVQGRAIVGIMGGHALARDSEAYRQAAHLAHGLARAGRIVATGGGPGAMEAGNLGARAVALSPAELDEAIDELAAVPSFHGSIPEWIASARRVAERVGDGVSLGIPTWHYGHEPPNSFATSIAKYFQNSVREDILLRVANAGIVVLPGSGGTVQEIFQDACENSYAEEGAWAPLVLLGERYWTEQLPAWPLLQAVMRGKPGEAGIALVDDVADAVAAIAAFDPAPGSAAMHRPAPEDRR
ncbi:Rossmann fold nucleotide-binding protein [Agrococcus sediminis]|uniref:Rossmann fold nucleotide-binding protein n=1 Tax=Agrococcus sediminis TaxID=2599924 RepID=A0A5M8QCP7_9MICO|nr:MULTISPECIES: LOG family protein [Agrococcus]KAA6432928.1 Rossmann fold nucleotide-binding protein [Agrococcus sediminis]UOW00986.1 LOG family protein [Agrococcus sp. SCSIO52902]